VESETFSNLKGDFTVEEKQFLKSLGLDDEAIKGITRAQLQELRGDHLKLAPEDTRALHGLGLSDKEIAQITPGQMDNLREIIKASIKV
jgi:hypothetical protein